MRFFAVDQVLIDVEAVSGEAVDALESLQRLERVVLFERIEQACLCQQIGIGTDIGGRDLARVGELTDLDVLSGLDFERFTRRPDVAFDVDLLAL